MLEARKARPLADFAVSSPRYECALIGEKRHQTLRLGLKAGEATANYIFACSYAR